jgi:hypothetical protein
VSYADEVKQEAARRQARRDQGKPLNPTPDELQAKARADDDRLEREIQAECVKEYRANGFIVYEGLREKRKTRIQPGQPDLTLFHIRAKWHGYHEVKTPAGKLRPDQEDFKAACDQTGTPHFVGGIDTARQVIAIVHERREKQVEPPLHNYLA